MSAEENKAVQRQIMDVLFEKWQWDRKDEFFSPDVVVHEWGHSSGSFGSLLPHERVTIMDMVAEGDRVSVWARHEGTATGRWETPWGTFTADNQRLVLDCLFINRFEDGRAVEAWVMWDLLGLLLQLGATIRVPRAGG